MRNTLYLGGMILACLPASAFAQSQPADSVSEDARDAGEIIVTAQRRAERLVDVPISVNSISQDDLERKKIDSILDLSKAATSLRFEGHTPAFQPTLRGVGSQVQGAGVDSNVAVYVDGFYQANNYGMGFDLPNVSNVQVLKGPQGTLFGRNATGGAILITTAEPSDVATGRMKIRYASYNDMGLQGYVSGPLGDGFAAGLSLYYRKGDGYIRNISTGADDDGRIKQFNIRPDVMFTSGDFKLRLIYEHGYNFNATGLGASYPDDYNIFGAIGVPVAHKPSETAGNIIGLNRTKSDGAYALAELQLGDDVTLKSNTGYRHDRAQFVSEGDFSPADLLWVLGPTDNRTFSQELVLSGTSGRLDWVTGVNYFRNTGKEPDSSVVFGGTKMVLKSQTVKTNSWAAFADLTFEASDGLFLTAGGRYSTEKKVSDTLLGGVLPLPTESERWNKFTPRAVVRYQLEPSTNIYASYSKGFRSGAFTGFPPNKVNPETLDAYEVGFKHASPVFDLNAAAFFYNYKDAQVTIIELNGQGKTLNAGNQHNYGAELEIAVRPVPNWSINVAGAYLRAKYTDFDGAAGLVKVPVQIAPGFSVPGGWAQISQDASGTYAPRSPKWTGNFSSTYDIDVGAGTIRLAGNMAWTSHFFHFTNENMREPGFAKVDLNVSFTTKDDHWRGELFVTNVTNKRSAAERIGGPFGTIALYTPPRVWGATLSYSF